MFCKKIVFRTRGSRKTRKWGEKLGGFLGKGDLIALEGELGTGKTQFVKGIAKGLGISNFEYVGSPSFTLLNEHEGRLPLYHFDFYRLNSLSELEELGYEEYFYGRGVAVIEWADKFPEVLPSPCLVVSIKILGKRLREFELTGEGSRYQEILEKLERKEMEF